MTQDGAKRLARDRALLFDDSHPMTRCRPTKIIENRQQPDAGIKRFFTVRVNDESCA